MIQWRHELQKSLAALTLVLGVAISSYAELPSGYTELEWIDANGAQAIDTGYTPAYTDRIVMKFRFQDQMTTGRSSHQFVYSDPTRCFFCARNTSAGEYIVLFYISGKLRMDYKNTNKTASSYDFQPGDHVYEFDGNTRVGTMDGTTIFSGFSASTGNAGSRLILFYSHKGYASMDGSQGNPAACRLYRFTVYDKDNTLKLDLVPARDDNATDIRRRFGVYDTVAQKFITNYFSTGGGFGAGEKRSSIKYWTGEAGDGKWSSSGNWTNVLGAACVPANGDSLEIPASADTAMENDLSDLALGPVYFRNRRAAVTLSGNSLTLNGEPRWAAEGPVALDLPLVFGGTTRNGVVLSNMATNWVKGAVSGTGGLNLAGYGSILQFQKPVTYAGGTEINAGVLWVTNLTALGTSTIYLNGDVSKHNVELLHPHTATLWLQTDSFSTPLHIGPAAGTSPAISDVSHMGNGYNVQLMRKDMVCSSRVTGEDDALFSPRCAAYWSSYDHSNAIRAQPVYYDGDIDLANGNIFSLQFQGTGGSAGGFMQLRGAVRAKKFTQSVGGNGVNFLMNAGNAIGDYYVNNMHLMANGVANSFGGAVVHVDMNSQYNSSKIALGCADQNIDRIVCGNFIGDTLASATAIRVCSGGQIRNPTTGKDVAATPAGFPRLVMRATGNSTVDYYFYNKVALVWWPTDSAYTMTCTNRVSATTGEIVVSNGTFRIANGASFAKSRFVEIGPGAAFCDATTNDYALAAITNLSIGAGGRFYTLNGVMPFAGNSLRFNFDGEGDGFGRLELADDAELVPAGVTTNGIAVRAGVYTGADGVAGATKVPWLKGACRLTVATGAAAATWTGEAPSTDDIHEPMNWDVQEEVNLMSGTFLGTFASSGDRADVGDEISVQGFTFNLPGSSFLFRKTSDDAEIGMGVSGITFPAATTAQAVTNEIPVKINGIQTWTIGENQTFVQKGGLRGDAGTIYTLTQSTDSGGVLEIDAGEEAGTFPGSFTAWVKTGTTLILKGDSPLGPSTSDIPFWLTASYGDVPWLPKGTIGLGAERTGVFYPGTGKDNAHKHIQLAGTRIAKQVQFAAACTYKAVCSMAGTTNEFAAPCKMEHNLNFWVEDKSKLIFSGGLIGRYVSQGGGDFYFRHEGASTYEIRNRPFYSPIGIMDLFGTTDGWQDEHFRFAVTTNQICWIRPYGMPMGVIDCDVPNVFGGKTQITLSDKSALDLHGNDQYIAAIHEVAAGAAIRSEAPATLFVSNVLNTTINSNTSVTAANGLMKGAFEGAVSVVKRGDIALTLSGASTSTGTLAVEAGSVVFASGGSWLTAPCVTVASGATLELDHKGALSKEVELTVAEGGILNLNGDFKVRVKALNDAVPGVYSAANPPEGVTITGSGRIAVRGGLVITVF